LKSKLKVWYRRGVFLFQTIGKRKVKTKVKAKTKLKPKLKLKFNLSPNPPPYNGTRHSARP